jgi:hypothetical protein
MRQPNRGTAYLPDELVNFFDFQSAAVSAFATIDCVRAQGVQPVYIRRLARILCSIAGFLDGRLLAPKAGPAYWSAF